MSENKHTPGKLKIWKYGMDPNPSCALSIKEEGILFQTIQKNDKANAERLVKCWNSHDALLEACEAAQLMLLQTDWNGDPRMGIVSAAISKAKGA